LITSTNENAILKSKIEPKISNDLLNNLSDNAETDVLTNQSINGKRYYYKYFKINNIAESSIGYFAIPFLVPNSLKNQETNELIGSVLSIFTAILIIFLIVSAVLSRNLTKPLSLITNYLQNTNIEKENKPIAWESDDELGLLVKEYNKMLEKIEDGKRNISQNEKQMAWQDIAKQVAHEIKNPLTPMRLTLQHLQNVMKAKSEIKYETFEKSIKNLIFNIDNVTDIVDSFSAFARLPLPKNEKIDLLKPFLATYELHNTDGFIKLSKEPGLKKAAILGDEKLIAQILTNLIINAFHSKRENVSIEVSMTISKKNNNYLITISDNGIGINEDLKNKIFIPNFTTKPDGSGIGLSLAKWGIDNMNGKIWFESEIQKGTTFFIEMPAIS
jgi:two-component system, NtrC family, nitrogen regulation sensor histidine kinase NtrY